MPEKAPTLDELGDHYRTAKASIAEHRRLQAAAETAHQRLAARLGHDHPDVAAARDAMTKAHADVQWCQAVTVAAGEAFKGRSLADVLADQTTSAGELRSRALAALDDTGAPS